MDKRATVVDAVYDPLRRGYVVEKKYEPSVGEIKKYIKETVPPYLQHYVKDALEEVTQNLKEDKASTIENILRETCDGYVKFAQNAKKNNFSRHSCGEYYERAREIIDLIEWIQDHSEYKTSFEDQRPKGFSM